MVALKRAGGSVCQKQTAYLELVYLVTALVPSETACLASSPGGGDGQQSGFPGR